jgi:hypothetical protein
MVYVVVGILVFGAGVRLGYDLLSDKVSCFNTYANRLADSLEPRQTATASLQEADLARDLALLNVLTPGHNHRDIAALRRATADKVSQQNALNRKRDANPYPDPPREVC